jgi:hypothetical protein
LSVVLDANTGPANRNLSRTQAALKKTQAEASRTGGAFVVSSRHAAKGSGLIGNSALRAASHLKRLAGTALAAGAAIASVAGAKKAISVTTDLAKTTLSLNKNLGIGVKRASEFAAVLKSRGVETTKVNMAFGTLSKQVKSAGEGSAKAAGNFQKLGISQRQLATLKPDALMGRIADGMKKLGPGTQRTAIGMTMFGRGWQQIVPLLRGGSAEMNNQLALADKYGATFGGKTIKSMQQWIQAQRESKLAMMGLQVTFTTTVVPALTAVMNGVSHFIANLRAGKGVAGQFGAAISTGFNVARNVVASVVTSIGGFLHRNRSDFQTFGRAIANVFGFVRSIVARVLPGIIAIFSGWGKVIGGVAKVIGGVLTLNFGKAWSGVKQIFSGALQTIGGVLRTATAPFREIAARIGHGIVSGFHSIAKIPGFVRGIFGTVLGFIRSLPGKAAAAIGGLASTLKNKVVSGFESAANKVVDFINAIIGVINKIPGVEIGKVGHVGGGGGSAKTNRKNDAAFVKGHATGGKVTSPTYMVGEQAPHHPEYVIATNPSYRKRNVGLWAAAGHELGVPGFAVGGVTNVGTHHTGGLGSALGAGAKGALTAIPGAGPVLGLGLDAAGLIGKLPGLGGLPGWLGGTGKWALGKAKGYITHKIAALAPDIGGLFSGESSSKGLVPQVTRALAFARSHGWHGSVTSGFRSRAEQAILYARYLAGGNIAAPPGRSNHEQGRAVDVSDIPGFAHAMSMAPANARLYSRVPGDPVHFSVDGHKKGGVIGRARGGVIGRYNRRYHKHGSGGGGAQFNERIVRQIAESVGFSPRTALMMAQIAHGESTYQPGVVSSDGGWGLWQMTPRTWGAEGVAKMNSLGGLGAMLNPIQNAKMAKYLYDRSGFGPWYGTQYLNRNVGRVKSVLPKHRAKHHARRKKAAHRKARRRAATLGGTGSAPDYSKQFGRFELGVAQAALTPGLDDDIAAAWALGAQRKGWYDVLMGPWGKGVDTQTKVAAANDVKQSWDDLASLYQQKAGDGTDTTSTNTDAIEENNRLLQQNIDLQKEHNQNQADLKRLMTVQSPQILNATMTLLSQGLGMRATLGRQAPAAAGRVASL